MRPSGAAFFTPSVAVTPPPPGPVLDHDARPAHLLDLGGDGAQPMSELPPAATATTTVIWRLRAATPAAPSASARQSRAASQPSAGSTSHGTMALTSSNAVMLFHACGPSANCSQSAAARFGMPDRMAVGLVSRTYFNMPLWIAQEHGFFADEGLEVEGTISGNASQVPPLLDGTFQAYHRLDRAGDRERRRGRAAAHRRRQCRQARAFADRARAVQARSRICAAASSAFSPRRKARSSTSRRCWRRTG